MNREPSSGAPAGERLPSSAWILTLIVLASVFLLTYGSAAPDGPSSVNVTANETKTTNTAYTLNTSGGYITTVNITAVIQKPHWKAFIGWVSGRFTLNDATGATVYDWSLSNAAISGEVYATRNSSTISWSAIKCANTTILTNESLLMNHTNSDDNITRTFNDTTHSAFVIGSVSIAANSCPTLNTYVNNASQQSDFEEVALFDGLNQNTPGNIVYATILEQDRPGFDSNSYDFQMIVPENGASTWTGSTAYYLYVELN